MSTRTASRMPRGFARLMTVYAIFGAASLAGCALKPEVVIVNDTPVAIKADVQWPATTTINGYPLLGKRRQEIIASGASDSAADGVDIASRKIWLRVVSLSISDASLISPAVDPFEFSVGGRGAKVILTVTAEGRSLRVVAVDGTGATLSLLPYPSESPRPPDTRQPVFDSIGFPGEDVR